MEQAKIDKIRRVLACMDNGYWEDLAYQVGVSEERLQAKADELLAVLVKVQTAQCDVLGARSAGFRQIVQAADTAASDKGGRGSKTAAKSNAAAIETIVAENAAKLAELTNAKTAALAELSGILTDIQAIFDEAAKLGEAFTAQPPADK
ncbi:hypothetical protein AGMMS49975_17740 [Clostridia bacterium]|nr:hypothetical protein AGMMS49975_17740 [Clostridia bacterium]